MWKFAVVCAALLAFSAPSLAQEDVDPPAPPPDAGPGPGPGVSPGMLVLGAAGLGLGVWGLTVALKKNSTPTPLTCAQLHPSIAATTC